MDSEVLARPRVFLLPGRDKRVRAGGPWVYSNELRMDAEAKAIPPGTIVDLLRVDGKPLGVASFNPHALIAARLYARDPHAEIGTDFIAARIASSLALRERMFDAPYYRLIHAEADGLPGTIIDRYGDAVVCQINTAGGARLEAALVTALEKTLDPAVIHFRGDTRARSQEGLDADDRAVKGSLTGPVTLEENGVKFLADLEGGQKTGWFFDQRRSRAFVAGLAAGLRVIDLYCYGGGFAIQAACAGADEVTGIDRSDPALALAEQSAELNGVAAKCRWQRAEVFKAMEDLTAERARFDLVVADPPAFVKSKKDLNAGLRGYRKLARQAAQLTAPGGILFVASCSYNVDAGRFADEVAKGVAAAGREGRILRSAGAGPDHPVHPYLPETAYLKTLVLQLD